MKNKIKKILTSNSINRLRNLINYKPTISLKPIDPNSSVSDFFYWDTRNSFDTRIMLTNFSTQTLPDNPQVDNIKVIIFDNNGKKNKELNILLDPFETKELIFSEIIDDNAITLMILAGFMKILPESITDKYDGMIINIHPSLLPKHKGLNTHQKVIESKDNFHGASVHYVTSNLDEGPVIIQGKYEVDKYDEDILKQKVHEIEHQIYPIAIKWFVEGNINKLEDKFLFNDEVLECPIEHILNH